MKPIQLADFLDVNSVNAPPQPSFTNEYAFLNILSSVINHCQVELSNAIPQELKLFIHPSCFDNYILSEFKTICAAMLNRACVLELHAAREKGLLRGDSSVERFQYFVNEITKLENSRSLFQKYPELERQINIVINQLMVVTKELISRLVTDKQVLYQQYLADTFKLNNITVAGDKHQQGRSVLILEFNSSKQTKKIVYKPRSLAIDEQFGKLVEWLNKKSIVLDLMVPKVISKNGYGWSEYIVRESCDSLGEIKAYYQRLGQWLLLTYLLNGSDLHYENIISHGVYPCIIDFECFFQPFFSIDNDLNRDASRHLVTETAFLPQKVLMQDQMNVYDVSILGIENLDIKYEVLEWADAGTDNMRLQRVRKSVTDFCHLPVLKNVMIFSHDYYADVVTGFENAYKVILSNIEEFKNQLNLFNDVRIRILFRNTGSYAKLMTESYHPALLANKKQREEHFGWLKKQGLGLSNQIIHSELIDLMSNDIPLFYAYSDGYKIYDSYHQAIDVVIHQNGLQWVKNNLLSHVNLHDLQLQKMLIENSFAAAKMSGKNKINLTLPSVNAVWSQEKINQFSLAYAREQIDFLANAMIENRGRVFWPTVKPVNEEYWSSTFTDIYLYDGVAGVALSFAYAAEVFNDAIYKKIAYQCLQSLRGTLVRQSAIIKNVGAFSGLSGLLYVFTVFYKLWRDESIKEDILNGLNQLTELFVDEKSWDIISGTAGCLVVLLRIHDAFPGINVDKQLMTCVQHILQNPTLAFSQKPLVGFSHGVSGVIWALEQYQYRYPNPDVTKWIMEARHYEESCFDVTHGNWLDLRTNHFMTAWCHGAAGIALSRLDGVGHQVDVALATTTREGFNSGSCLCHGDLGNLDALLSAGRRHEENFKIIATGVMQKIEKHGVQCSIAKNAIHPGLMTGIAGVAYELMRIAHTDIVPSVLLLKT